MLPPPWPVIRSKTEKESKMANETHDAGPEKATDFVQVNSWFPDDPLSPQTEMIHRDDLSLFIDAQIRLHVDPGVDPVSKKKQKFLERITVSEMLIERGSWLTMPNLGEVAGEKGARRLVEGDDYMVWLHPDYATAEEADYRQMLREEAEFNS
jgi:hypothetical protein